MDTKALTALERYNYYKTYLLHDFLASEVKPFELIEKLVQQEKYLCYGFFEDKEPFGYAYFAKADKEQALLLDYFAVLNTHRSKGLGSSFLTEIKNALFGKYLVLFAEVENPSYSLEEDNKKIRTRRIEFYLKNGFTISNILSRILTDEYLILTLDLGGQHREDILFDELQQIYLTSFGKDFFDKNIYMRIIDDQNKGV
jgi:GNAT superfamily N-acetyltransferase